MKFRIGIGYDLHRLGPSASLILGGVEIPHEKGLIGHSDGDVLSHAITDALLGAIGAPDLGELFPPDDPRYKAMDSRRFVAAVWPPLRRAGWTLRNADVVVILERPKLAPWKRPIAEAVAGLLGIPAARVGVQAKTMEGLGGIGAGRAVAAQVVVLLERRVKTV